MKTYLKRDLHDFLIHDTMLQSLENCVLEIEVRMFRVRDEQSETILKLTWPVFVELFLGSLFGMVDMMMLGRYGSHDISTMSIASVGFTNQIMFIGLSLVSSLCTGATAIIARYIGMKREDRVTDVLSHIILITQLFLAVPLVILGIIYGDRILLLLGAEPDTIAHGMGYYRIILVGFLFQAFNFSIFSALRGSGDTKTPMKINILVNVLNVVGNAVLIYGVGPFPELGIWGAGISTSLAQVVASVICLWYILDAQHLIHINLKKPFKFDRIILKNLTKIGVPAALEQVAFRVGILRFVQIVAGLGTMIYATHQICLNILSLSFSVAQAFSTATSALVGKSLGAGDEKLAQVYIKKSRNIGIGAGAILGVVMYLFGKDIIGLYNHNPDVIAAGSMIMPIIAIIQPIQNAQFIVAGGLRGAGDTVWTLISTFVSVFVIRIVMAKFFILQLNLGLVGAWYAMLVDQGARLILTNVRYYSNRWKYVTIQ